MKTIQMTEAIREARKKRYGDPGHIPGDMLTVSPYDWDTVGGDGNKLLDECAVYFKGKVYIFDSVKAGLDYWQRRWDINDSFTTANRQVEEECYAALDALNAEYGFEWTVGGIPNNWKQKPLRFVAA